MRKEGKALNLLSHVGLGFRVYRVSGVGFGV